MRILRPKDKAYAAALADLHRDSSPDPAVSKTVAEILAKIAAKGDAALLELSERFDGVRPDPLRIPESELAAAWNATPSDLQDALRLAHRRILDFHQQQIKKTLTEAVNDRNQSFVPATHYAMVLMGDEIATNIFMLGYAWQKGLVPLSLAALDKAVAEAGLMSQIEGRRHIETFVDIVACA